MARQIPCPSRQRPRPRQKRRSVPAVAAVVPMFVCPGAHDEPLEYAIFPLGFGYSSPVACPLRPCCKWYCRYDLGGKDSLLDFPDDAILPADFERAPFSCKNFQPDDGT